jgi:hypothetical protein
LNNAIRKFAFDSLRNQFLYDVKRSLDISTPELWQVRFSEF